MTAAFLGIDLAWKSEKNPTGAAVLSGDCYGAELLSIADPLRSLDAVKYWISAHVRDTTFIAIDAPLVINNAAGQRRCECLVGSRYGARHASCHTSNLALYPHAASVQLAGWLQRKGFTHAADSVSPHTMLEVYPHAAIVALFDLAMIIKYKKGRVAMKCAGLLVLQAMIRRLASEEAALKPNRALEALLAKDPLALRGADRKCYEDSLDAIICAYLAYYFWRFGAVASEVFGSAADGYIVNPRLRPNQAGPAAE